MESKTEPSVQIALFSIQVVLWTAWTLWIKFSQTNGAYTYDTITVVLMSEFVKLAIMQGYYLFYTNSKVEKKERLIVLVREWKYGLYFAVPALLYWVYNLLFYVNMAYFDPGTFRVLINVRILILGVLITLVFGARLSLYQWAALLLLAGGCAVNQIGPGFTLDSKPFYLMLLMVQASLSAFAGVYNELLLKQEDHRPFAVKNTYLYFFSIILSFLYAAMTKPELLTGPSMFFHGWSWVTVVLVFLQALCGVSTSLLLRHLNVILKEYAQAAEMIATALVAWWILDAPLTARLILSCVLVAISAVLYSRKQETSSSPSSSNSNSSTPLPTATPNVAHR